MAIDVPPLDDPSHNAVRGELARLLVLHKADLGAGHFSDAAIVAHVDDVAAVVLARFLSDRERFAAKWPALADALDRLQADQPGAKLDG